MVHRIGRSLAALPLLMAASTAIAKVPASGASKLTPIGSPGAWLRTDDYPVIATRLGMSGVTAFRLHVAPTGTPSRCEIVQSSGFDLLDAATCERLMANARFTPERNLAGKPTEAVYASRVNWKLPSSADFLITEQFGSMHLVIEETGKVTSCRFIEQSQEQREGERGNPCIGALNAPSLAMGLEIRKSVKGLKADVEMRYADVFSPEVRARVLAPVPGYEQVALSIHRFSTGREGSVSACAYEEQRGSAFLAGNFCLEAKALRFDPPFSAIDANGQAVGWHIARVLVKTSQ